VKWSPRRLLVGPVATGTDRARPPGDERYVDGPRPSPARGRGGSRQAVRPTMGDTMSWMTCALRPAAIATALVLLNGCLTTPPADAPQPGSGVVDLTMPDGEIQRVLYSGPEHPAAVWCARRWPGVYHIDGDGETSRIIGWHRCAMCGQRRRRRGRDARAAADLRPTDERGRRANLGTGRRVSAHAHRRAIWLAARATDRSRRSTAPRT